MIPQRLRELVTLHGFNSNAFLTMYEGFSYFETADGIVAYYERPFAWVAAGEPLASADLQLKLFTEFAAAAKKAGKAALCLPAFGDFVHRAEAAGFGTLMIGSEPTVRLETYPKTGFTWLTIVPTAKQLHGKGARVREVDLTTLTTERRRELDGVTQEWLATRKMAALSFLNKVEPWTLSADKKYFEIVSNGRTTAFLAAIPIWPRKGWYLIDLMRRTHSEAGTSELLLLEAMRLLKEQGALEVTFGVAPLSNLENAPERQRKTRLNKMLRNIYASEDLLYNFGSLHQFKLKFQPNHVANVFLVYSPTRLGPLMILSLLQAFVPHGITVAVLSGAWRTVKNFDLPRFIKTQLAPGVVVRSAPPTMLRLLYRCRLTVASLLGYFLVAALTLTGGKLRPELAQDWAFSYVALRAQPVHALALAPFLHWNLIHLLTNAGLAVFFCGLLEYLSGSLLAVTAFGLAAALANPLACIVFQLGASHVSELDVGASLGILGCAGALVPMLRHGRILLPVLLACAGASAFFTQSQLGLNHVFAILVGWAVARLFLRN